jgi:C1A family cysteine protease
MSTRVRPRRRHTYGWLRDLPDQRDFLYRLRHPAQATLPGTVDLRQLCSPVEDQGTLGSCTAQALVGALEYLEHKDGLPVSDLSRLFLYYNERVLIGTVSWDSGAMLRDGIKTLSKDGICMEARWPYVVSRFKRKPTAACYREASKHHITSYERLENLTDMQSCLAEGFPFVFGFSVYESFESQEVARTGVVPMPGPKERVLGGHAVLAVGYIETEARFIVRNSWGTRWGQAGYFTMPFAYLEDRNLSDDFWVIRRGENV